MLTQRSNSTNSLMIFGLLLLGFTIRIVFSFWASKFYFGDIRFTFGDSFSYTQAFVNLVQYGTYTFDPSNLDAALYRGPTYPFFWGAHYLIFGEDLAYKAVAVSQSILDTISGLLIFFIIRNLSHSSRLAILGSALYLFNPIFLVHVPITGTETFATFLTLLIMYLTVRDGFKYKLLVIGALCALAVMTRQYLGLLLPTTMLYLFAINNFQVTRKLLVSLLTLTLGFILVVSPWFFRNLINHNVPTILMGGTTGYASYQADYISFTKFYTLYYVDVTPIYKSVAIEGRDGLVDNESNKESLADYRVRLNHAAALAHECGPSFRSWREALLKEKQEIERDCTEEVVKVYTDLREEVLKKNGWRLLVKVPLKNIQKAIFKSDLTALIGGWNGLIIQTIFFARTIIVLMGLAFIYNVFNIPAATFLFFPLTIILYITTIGRQVEMRYLVQSDAVLIIFAVLFIGTLRYRYKSP